MAELCLKCWNKFQKRNDSEKMFVLSDELDLCEECGEYGRVIVSMRKRYLLRNWLMEWRAYLRHRRNFRANKKK